VSETTSEATVDLFAGLPAIFKECADPESVRYALDRPCVQDGWVYCTDGRIAVRMPWEGEERPEWAARNGRFPKGLADSVFIAGHEDSETPIPPGMHMDQVPCDWCEPKYRDWCESCDGTGLMEPDDYHDPVDVGRLRFGRRLLAMLQKHGVTGLYLPAGDAVPSSADATPGQANHFAAKFVLGDIEGRLMPMVSDR
jgi:hypothetical protein